MAVETRRPTLIAALTLVVLSLATRWPALINAAGTNSDAAVVGLQARHIAHGEWSPFLWGSTYQTSADATWAALLFRVFGASPLVLMLSALVLHVALTLFVFYTIRRRLEPAAAFVASLPLVFTTACVHSYALYPPRQLALTLAFAAFWAIDRKRGVSLACGGALALLAVVADPYASIFVPAALVLAVLTVLGSRQGVAARARALSAFVAGSLVGALPLAWLLARPESRHGVTSMSLSVLGHNADLLWRECLPWALGSKVFKPLHVMDYVEWNMPLAYAVVAYVGVASLVVAVAWAIGMGVRRGDRLAAIAWFTLALNFGSFLVSRMVMDHFSMRYLAASVLVLPFAIAPLAQRIGATRLALFLAPYLFVAGAGGWLAHGRWVRGPIPVRIETGAAEAHVLHALEERHVEAAIADYWAAYRLDFLWAESIPVVPYHLEQDRYPPYRARFEGAKRFAYIYDRGRSFEDEAEVARELAKTGSVVERFTWEAFDVVVFERGAP